MVKKKLQLLTSLIKRWYMMVSGSYIYLSLRKYATKYQVSLRIMGSKLIEKFKKLKPTEKVSFLFLSSLIIFSTVSSFLQSFIVPDLYMINSKAEKLLIEKQPYYAQFFELDNQNNLLEYNKGYQPGLNVASENSNSKFSAVFYNDPEKGIEITDPVNSVSVGLKPKFNIGKPQLNDNRVVYPLLGEFSGYKIVSIGAIGYKEDIVLDDYSGDNLLFEYELTLPEGVEARMENDGSLSFYGVDPTLLGDISTNNEKDAELLSSARKNGEKNFLLFKSPAPYILEGDREVSNAEVWYTLDGNVLALHTGDLKNLIYPISIDPSIYVETARKLMRGNNETNIDFDVDNELIKKSFTTGARFNSWNNTMNLNDGRWNHGTAVAGGYIYAIGGEKSSGNITTFATSGADTYVVPTGVTSITVKMWGAGGGGGGSGVTTGDGDGGAGGGGGFSEATISVTPSETLDIYVGAGGAAGNFSTGTSGSQSGDGGGGGGRSFVERSGTPLTIAAGGAGGGGGDNSSSVDGGAGGAGGGSSGLNGSASSSAPGGSGGTQVSGGAGGNGSGQDGTSGSSENGGAGGDGGNNGCGTGGMNNGGNPNGGDGGIGDDCGNGFGAGGGGGDGYFGGGGGSASISGNAGGGGGGGGSGYVTGTSTTLTAGSGTVPGNDSDSQRSGAGDGGTGGVIPAGNGSPGDDGRVIISYITAGSGPRADVYWAQLSTTNNSIVSPNPGDGACTDWCTDSAYDLPDERVGFSLVAYNGFLYAIGGEDDTGTIQSTVYIAKLGANGEPSLWHPTDSNKNNWVYWYASSNTLSTATSYASAVAYNNRLYLLGGETSVSPGGVTTVYSAEFDPTGDIQSWTTSGMTVLPSARRMQSVQVYNDYIYLIGGANAGATQSTIHYTKINRDGTLNTWTSTNSFTTARATWGGSNSVIWGGYIYIMGGCATLNGSGYCTSTLSDIQLASINSDGTLDEFTTISGLTNARIGYGLAAWDNALYRIGGCATQNTTTGECDSPINQEDYAVINPAGEVSTVRVTETSGTAPCSGGSPQDCDLPPTGDSAGQGGQMLAASIIFNGHLYVIGGCTNYSCSDTSGNVSYVAVSTDGSLVAPSSCSGTSYGAWCVDSTNRVNGTTGVAAAGIAAFNNRIYIVGGLNGGGNNTNLYYNTVNSDGSLTGAWTAQDLTSIGAEDVGYTYAFTRANPNSASSVPGNLYLLGGCEVTSGAGCSSSGDDRYSNRVYKCNIGTSGAISSCTTTNQLQIDANPDSGGSTEGIGAHTGTIYANRLYLIGGLDEANTDRDKTIFAEIDDSNNIVAPSGYSAWVEDSNVLSTPRRRGSGFGYNGHLYAVGGYDAGAGTLPFIEWAKLSVSDGSLNSYTTSDVEITQRWGLTMVVSNSYAYVIGGCDVGASPGSCTSFEPSVQTFQIYNNDSGATAGYSASSNQFGTDRYGGSAVVHDGYIYLAGGCTDSVGDCSSPTSSVQYAQLDALGNIGTWSATSSNLPAARGWGQLEEAGGTLYYIGGQDASGDEKGEVYYTAPETSGPAQDIYRTTEYKINSTEFSGASYTMTLNNDLSEDYFVMIAGGVDTVTFQGPDEAAVRVDADPFGNFATSTGADELRLARGGSDNNWLGSITVVECLRACASDGFELKEVLDTSLSAGSGNTLQTTNVTLSEDHTDNTVPFGGYYGGGMEAATTAVTDFTSTLGVRLYKSSSVSDRLVIERYGAQSQAPTTADLTTYIVEWGSNWNIQEVNVDNWNAGGSGVDATGEYTTSSITSVTRDNTWLWKSPGTSQLGGLGNGAFGKVLTLGDGVNQSSSESNIALGSYINDVSAVRDDTVYVMEHTSLANDYRFKSQANNETTISQTVDAYIGSESYSTSGNLTITEGYRVPLYYHGDAGTNAAYTKVAGWSLYHSASTTITADKTFYGNTQAGWFQSVDFASIDYNPVAGDSAQWHQATNGLPADRTQFGAASWNDRLYVVGGIDDSASETNTVYISPQLTSGGDITSSWSSDADVPDQARSGHMVMAYANNLYLFGGFDGSNYLLDTQYSQINSDGTVDAWSYSRQLPTAVRQGDGFIANGYVYIIGGRTSDNTCESTTYVAPISANTTIATGNNPTGIGEWYETNQAYTGDRFGNAVAYNEGRIYVLGGGCISDNATTYSTVGSDTYTVPTGITSVTVKMWGAGGGGAAGGTNGNGGSGGGAGYVQSTLTVTPSESLNIYVGAGGGGGTFPGTSGGGGGGGGHSEIDRSGTRLLIAAGGAGGGGGDNSSSTAGGQGGAGGGTTGATGGSSGTANGGTGGTQAAGGTGGTGGNNNGGGGGLESGGAGANGVTGTGGEANGGAADGGDGGTADTGGWAGGGGAGGGYYGGGGGSASASGDAGGGGGGGGSNYLSGASQTDTQGSGSSPGNSSDSDRAGAGQGGSGGGTSSVGSSGSDGIVLISTGSSMTLTSANRTTQSTLLSQPQTAKYSRLIDTDSDVFPTNFLMNGIDNSIGARWEVKYTSSTNASSSWGQETDFGEVTLGTVNSYTPLDGSGANTEFARFYFFWIEIDSSQTFGYPDDVTRGPTINDITLYFTSDPSKRLRHGKTFTGGEKQPLDTPPGP